MTETADVVIVGAGMIGAAIAWRCAQRGLAVTLVDPEPERGAWHTAAGMLAPVTESHYTETALLRLNLDSLSRYPRFVAELSDATGLPTGLRECGTVSVAWDGADLAALRDLHGFLAAAGVAAAMLNGDDVRELEPALAAGIPGGLLAAEDHAVDPRLLHDALLTGARLAGATLVRSQARLVRTGGGSVTGRVTDTVTGRVTGIVTGEGTRIAAETTVLAAGAWSGLVEGAGSAAPPVRAVKGQTLRLSRASCALRHVVRATVKGSPVYIVPRGVGELVVGASSEEIGFDVAPRAGAVYELLRDAQTLLPELSEAVLEEVCTGLRPGTPDNAPLIGASGTAGLIIATGHYRNGVLLAPVTADAVAELITTGVQPDVVAAFAPTRFALGSFASAAQS